jgi:hypothetical protein
VNKHLFRTLAVIGLTGAIWLAYRAGQNVSGQSPGWVSYKDPLGFSLQLPRGWKASSDRKSGRIDVQGTQGEQVVIWPISFIPNTLDPGAASAVLARMTAALGINANWGTPQPARASAVRMTGRSGDRAVVSVLAWVTSPKGSIGYLYAMSARQPSYRQSEETFSKVLESFRVTGAPPGSPKEPSASMNYVRWQDPRENAFSMEAPAQWRTNGGLFRFASVDVRSAWETVSPDGQIRITGGDAELPPFTEPNQMLSFGGFHEGTWYSPGYGVRMLVRRYIPGAVFAREYVTTRAARGCADLKLTETRDRPDAVSALNAIYAQYVPGMSLRLTAGEAAFTCRRKEGQPVNGYYFAGTQRTQAAGMPGGLWTVEYLFGFLASEGKATLAQSVLDHMLASVQVNPQWAAMQQNVAANTSQIVSRTQEAISRTISSTYWSRQQTMDELSRRRSNATLGVTDVVDQQTGREIKVENSSNYYWIDHRGTIVGTQTDTRPNIDFRELTKLP